MGGNKIDKKEITNIGCFFIAIAAFLYASKHITAAIMTSNINSPDVNYFEGGFKTVGFGISFWIAASFLVGLILLIYGMLPIFQKNVPQKKEVQVANSEIEEKTSI